MGASEYTCCRWFCGTGEGLAAALRYLLDAALRQNTYVYSIMYCSALNCDSCSPSSRRMSLLIPLCSSARPQDGGHGCNSRAIHCCCDQSSPWLRVEEARLK
eukprot:GHUV01052311.1.p1 GENE.GHUV01052311.1~~GHUV01052311.1.p1  ORF type:complete len:102 (+),score=8.51 GHUV01052311.1:533-838(+)